MRRLNQFGKPSMISPRRLVAALASVSTAASVFAAGMSGSGGNVDFQDYKYMVHTFTNAGDFVLSGEGDVELLLVGGGGGGGGCIGGGGGGGGVISTNLYLTSGTYHITVGAGGAGANTYNCVAENGGSSTFTGGDVSIEAFGGGGGASANTAVRSTKKGGDGASGGGGGIRYGEVTEDKYAEGGVGIDGQGFAGGRGFISSQQKTHFWQWSGGGGGAGGPGGDGWIESDGSAGHAGTGGVGRVSCITGKTVYYGGGGGGGCERTGQAAGGLGGGGKGGSATSGTAIVDATSGEDGFGGGGGGAPAYMTGTQIRDRKGGDGGSGVVIVRYLRVPSGDGFESVEATGAQMIRDGQMRVYTFKNSGVFKVEGDGIADVLLVGGGGGGGAGAGGGGGGGGVVYRPDVTLTNGTYEITVGAGGLGAMTNGTGSALASYAQDGGDTTAFIWTAFGGGAGGSGIGVAEHEGANGANGGGAGANKPRNYGEFEGGIGLDGQGHAGGGSKTHGPDPVEGKAGDTHWFAFAGGGGGAGEDGGTAAYNYDMNTDTTESHPGRGGDGFFCAITGQEICYGGGGGGGTAANGFGALKNGGEGGGGTGASFGKIIDGVNNDAKPGAKGVDGLGGGGGGGGRYSTGSKVSYGGNGGCGAVIIRCRVQPEGLMLIFR